MRINIELLVAILLFTGCATKESSLDEREFLVDFENKFSKPYETIDSISTIETYQKVEEYFIFLGLLKDHSKQAYQDFYENCIIKNEILVDLKCLYSTYPSTELVVLPSNVGLVFSYYGERAGISQLDRPPRLNCISGALGQMKEGYDLNFNDMKIFEQYMDCVDDKDFKESIVYRLPIISFSLVDLDKR